MESFGGGASGLFLGGAAKRAPRPPRPPLAPPPLPPVGGRRRAGMFDAPPIPFTISSVIPYNGGPIINWLPSRQTSLAVIVTVNFRLRLLAKHARKSDE